MSRLLKAIRALEVDAEVELDGRWVTIQAEGCRVYVVQPAHGSGYYTWCDAPHARSVEYYRDPVEAIEAGLRRARQAGGEHDDG